ncbi:MAG: D-alanine--D-alanine ligase [Pseudomonadota bacterium]
MSMKHIAVIKGGWSAEREVSLSSGAQAASALEDAGYRVTEIDADPSLASVLADLKPDVVFNALHGRWGEDGCIQGVLEIMELPYTHSGVLASSLAMDKQRAKFVLDHAGVPTPKGVIVPLRDALDTMPAPFVVKPNNEGSSVGVVVVREGDNRARDALLQPIGEAEEVLVEKYIAGRELTAAVLGDRTFCVTEIVSRSDFYDYDSKYADGGSEHVLPADIPDAITGLVLEMALRAHNALGCRGLSRADFRYDERLGEEGLYCLEVNTQPGLTPTSLAPEQAAHCGLSFPELCAWLVEDASCQR